MRVHPRLRGPLSTHTRAVDCRKNASPVFLARSWKCRTEEIADGGGVVCVHKGSAARQRPSTASTLLRTPYTTPNSPGHTSSHPHIPTPLHSLGAPRGGRLLLALRLELLLRHFREALRPALRAAQRLPRLLLHLRRCGAPVQRKRSGLWPFKVRIAPLTKVLSTYSNRNSIIPTTILSARLTVLYQLRWVPGCLAESIERATRAYTSVVITPGGGADLLALRPLLVHAQVARLHREDAAALELHLRAAEIGPLVRWTALRWAEC